MVLMLTLNFFCCSFVISAALHGEFYPVPADGRTGRWAERLHVGAGRGRPLPERTGRRRHRGHVRRQRRRPARRRPRRHPLHAGRLAFDPQGSPAFLPGLTGADRRPSILDVTDVVNAQVGAQGGILLTASHNPGGIDGDFGVKFNTANGGPAADAVTDRIHRLTKEIAQYRTVPGRSWESIEFTDSFFLNPSVSMT